MTLIASIDPGISGTGVAIWSPEEGLGLTAVHVKVPVRSNNPKTPEWNWMYSVSVLCKWMAELIETEFAYPDDNFRIAIEFPQFMQGDGRSYAATAEGSTLKLAYLIGRYAEILISAGYRLKYVLPSMWKGQLPKDVVEQRIRRYLGDTLCNKLHVHSHAWDAVGIGLHCRKELFIVHPKTA